jgi:hypothetical protein
MSPSILIVDDEPDVAELFRQRFRREARQGIYVTAFRGLGRGGRSNASPARSSRSRWSCCPTSTCRAWTGWPCWTRPGSGFPICRWTRFYKSEVRSDLASAERAGSAGKHCSSRARGDKNSSPGVIAPTPWFQGAAAPERWQDPPYDQPCPYRRGHIERRGAIFLHFCIVCGAWGAFGYGITEYHPGRWYCSEHRPKK